MKEEGQKNPKRTKKEKSKGVAQAIVKAWELNVFNAYLS